MHYFSRSRLSLLLLSALIALFAASGSAVAGGGGKKLMTIRKAQAMAQRALVESIIGLKVRSSELWTAAPDSGADNYQVDAETSAKIQGVVFDTPKYDTAKDIAMVTASIRLGQVKNIIGKKVAYDDVVISRVGFATSTQQYQGQLSALRAAELNAYDEMARLLVGQEVSGKTKSRNFVLESDEVRTKTQAALWGAEVKDFGWQEDGNAFVKLVLNAQWVGNILGRKGGQDVYEVTGYGATHDDTQAAPAGDAQAQPGEAAAAP